LTQDKIHNLPTRDEEEMNFSPKSSNPSNAEKVGKEYWLLIPGKPGSTRARTKQAKVRLANYRKTIKRSASQIFNTPLRGGVEVHLYHFHKGTDIDLDNIQKPILDALTGIAYKDDRQVESLNSKRVNFGASTTLSNVTSPLIPKALTDKKECVIIGVKPTN